MLFSELLDLPLDNEDEDDEDDDDDEDELDADLESCLVSLGTGTLDSSASYMTGEEDVRYEQ